MKDQGIKREDLETLIIPKERLNELEEVKSSYYKKIEKVRQRALKEFKAHQFTETYDNLTEIIRMGCYGYDMDLLKNALILTAQVCIYFGEYQMAKDTFKQLRLVADEQEEL